ncbi:MAG: hypothetical protein QOJ25_2873 [Solirubrobacteraceae bacterium]|nr:hypothetical protein [Solirubrobacteraceae bacterium]
MSSLAAPLILVAARARRRPGRWFLTVLGVALAVAFAGAVVAEGTTAGDQGARSVLAGLTPQDRAVRITWQGAVTPSVQRRARTVLRGLGLGRQTEVVLLQPVRLSGIVVQTAAIAPLAPWAGSHEAGVCRPRACPVVLVAGSVGARRALSAPGVRLVVGGTGTLRSAAPLGFASSTAAGRPPLLLSADVSGLSALPALDSVYRTHSWLAELPTSRLESWQLAGIEGRLQRAQAALIANGSQFTMTAPFSALDAARAQASAAPRRLLLAGGGALAVLAAFVVIAAGGLRRDQQADLERLLAAGARGRHCALFVLGEAASLCAVALLIGAGIAVAVTAVLAGAASVPVGGVLIHSLVTPEGAAVLVAGWLGATTLVALVLVAPGRPVADVLAVAAAASLALELGLGTDTGDQLAVLLAPMCCLAAGVLTFRAAAALLRGAERLSRRGPVMGRLALVSLARAPAAPSLAIAFIAISTGLGAFALAYRSTLVRSAADQAANRVPLDATISPAADFTTPLRAAPLMRWRQIAGGGGAVLPVRRTYATYASGPGTVTVPALGVPATGIALIHGWRASDGSASLPVLARRLTWPGPARGPGPRLPGAARSLWLGLAGRAVSVTVTADLRDSSGAVRQVAFHRARSPARALTALIPPGTWELEALQLDEPVGLAITSGHQNAENQAAATQASVRVTLGPLRALDGAGGSELAVPVGRWRAVGAAGAVSGGGRLGAAGGYGAAGGLGASGPGGPRPTLATIRFDESGQPGVLRPVQPSDSRPVPVLVDPQAAAAATRSGLIALTVDGLPMAARVVGVLRRFPTVPGNSARVVVADQATLDAALDAQLPGQGRPDELWIATSHPERLRVALGTAPLTQLGAAFRAGVEHRLRSAPVARAVLGILIAATALAGVLAALGLLVALVGTARDPRVEEDLKAMGVGPRGLRRELELRLLIAGVAGVGAGLAIGLVLTQLAVAAVRAAGTIAVPQPPLVAVAPWGTLALWALAALTALALASLVTTRTLAASRRAE